MATATAPAPTPAPLREEGMRFWNQLVEECKKQTGAINRALSEHGRGPDDHIECQVGKQLHLIRSRYPSTISKVNIAFENWGPVLTVHITGFQKPMFGFHQEEFEMPLAEDGDGTVIAIFDEGRSLRPSEVACFLTQHFRRCYPRISLPCPEI